MKFNWQLPEWPGFSFETSDVQPLILEFAKETGEINGIIQGLPNHLKQETLLQLMMSEINQIWVSGNLMTENTFQQLIIQNL